MSDDEAKAKRRAKAQWGRDRATLLKIMRGELRQVKTLHGPVARLVEKGFVVAEYVILPRLGEDHYALSYVLGRARDVQEWTHPAQRALDLGD